MPITNPANIQQVLQMSGAVEKIQTQQALHLAVDQLQEEEEKFKHEICSFWNFMHFSGCFYRLKFGFFNKISSRCTGKLN